MATIPARVLADSSERVAATAKGTMVVSITPKERERTARAQRFVTELPVRYREVGTGVWHQGRTANISVSGVLFRAGQILQPKTEIEMTLTLPAVVRSEAAAELRCRGFVVRSLAGADSDPYHVMAASIAVCRISHGRRTGAMVR
jgi:hypothetical protein